MNITLTPDHIKALRTAAEDNTDPLVISAVILLGCLEIGDTATVTKPQQIWPDGSLKCIDCPGGKMCCNWGKAK